MGNGRASLMSIVVSLLAKSVQTLRFDFGLKRYGTSFKCTLILN